jgi:DNA-directed RNA polymerase specialized sigma24 family protein
VAIDDVKALVRNPPDTDDDAADLAAMFQRYVRPLLRYCACRVGTDAAEDIVAETLVIAYAQRQRFDPGRASALTWLYGIATNVARRHRRTEMRVYGRTPEAQSRRSNRPESIRFFATRTGGVPPISRPPPSGQQARLVRDLAIPAGTSRQARSQNYAVTVPEPRHYRDRGRLSSIFR